MYSVDLDDPDHEAGIRFASKAPRRRVHSLLQGIDRQGAALHRLQLLQILDRFAQERFEAADAEADQRPLDAVGDARPLADQRLALAARAPGVLLLHARNRHHRAMAALAAQPAQEHAQQHRRVEAVGLGALPLARHRNGRRMDHVGLDAALLEPARQPEAVPPRLVGHHHPLDRAASALRLAAPALDERQQGRGIRVELLQWLALHARNGGGDQPALGAQLDNGNERCILIEGGERTAEIVYLGHGAPSSVYTHTTKMPRPRRLRPIASGPARALRALAAPG